MENLNQHIESLIFAAQGPISYNEIKVSLEESFKTKIKKQTIQKSLETLFSKYKSDDFAFEIVEIAEGYQFFTKGAFHQTVGSHLKQTSKKRLSKAALETLAIIAYKQPVTKGDCERIRGVSCDYTIQKLLEKELVSISGRSEGPGRPLLYATSKKFMDYFGLANINDLPKPKDFKMPDEEIGEMAPIEELTPEEQIKADVAQERNAAEVATAILGKKIKPLGLDEIDEDGTALVTDSILETVLEKDEIIMKIDPESEDENFEGIKVKTETEEEAEVELETEATTEIETEVEEESEVEPETEVAVKAESQELEEIVGEQLIANENVEISKDVEAFDEITNDPNMDTLDSDSNHDDIINDDPTNIIASFEEIDIPEEALNFSDQVSDVAEPAQTEAYVKPIEPGIVTQIARIPMSNVQTKAKERIIPVDTLPVRLEDGYGFPNGHKVVSASLEEEE